MPQVTALIDACEARDKLQEEYPEKKFYIISDGGIKTAGDVVKSLCFADMVMIGNLFAGCPETPGSVFSMGGKTYKEYRGSSTHKSKHVEGVIAIVPTKESFDIILQKTLEGLRSGMSYQGAHNLEELRENPQFVRITNAGLIESHPHNVIL